MGWKGKGTHPYNFMSFSNLFSPGSAPEQLCAFVVDVLDMSVYKGQYLNISGVYMLSSCSKSLVDQGFATCQYQL